MIGQFSAMELIVENVKALSGCQNGFEFPLPVPEFWREIVFLEGTLQKSTRRTAKEASESLLQ